MEIVQWLMLLMAYALCIEIYGSWPPVVSCIVLFPAHLISNDTAKFLRLLNHVHINCIGGHDVDLTKPL